MVKKYLAYISPLENINGKDFVTCNVTFITGELNHKTIKYMGIGTSIFKYYYYGSTLEVVELNEQMQIIDIHDIHVEDADEFGVSLYNVLTLNKSTFDMLASNDITYNMKVNKYYTYCRQTVENIYNRMQQISTFVLRVYTINGAAVFIELDENPTSDSKYILTSGYVVADKAQLKKTSIRYNSSSHGSDKLSQDDINKLVTRLVG